MNSIIDRRNLLAAAGGAAVAAAWGGPVLALSEAGARQLVDQLVADINRVIASGKSEGAMIRDFEGIFARYADVPIMARYVLGPDARRLNGSQMGAFTQAFQGYIAKKYGRRFREFIGGEVIVRSTRQIKAGYEIRATADLQGQAPFQVSFLVSDKSGRSKFFNLYVEGVNMLLTERTEIGALLDRNGGDVNKLIAALG